MIEKLYTIVGKSYNPYENLALERYLTENAPAHSCTLYLWQNENTVVIGRNQNAWKECRVSRLREEGGYLSRRLSGGGAVFHDLANLNFTFCMCEEDYDVDRQLRVICEAVSTFGLHAVKTGRNDVTVDGRKFSGNAFYKHRGKAYHHGTILLDTDTEKMSRYLSPSKAKLESKGVDSVRSRVVNLKELKPDLKITDLIDALQDAFGKVYGIYGDITALDYAETMKKVPKHYIEEMSSEEWLLGTSAPMSFVCEGRFPWGGIELAFEVRKGFIENAKVFTDSMDWEIAEPLAKAFKGAAFDIGELRGRLDLLTNNTSEKTYREIYKDITVLLDKQDI